MGINKYVYDTFESTHKKVTFSLNSNPGILRVRSLIPIIIFLITIILNPVLLANVETDSVKVENVEVKLSGNIMYVEYNLRGSADEEYLVKIYLRREGVSSFQYTPMNVSGDIGQGKFAGNKRQIVWNFGSEFPSKMSGRDYYILINAKIINRGGNSLLYWIGGGAAVLAGGAAFILSSKKDGTPTTKSMQLPDAPDRP